MTQRRRGWGAVAVVWAAALIVLSVACRSGGSTLRARAPPKAGTTTRPLRCSPPARAAGCRVWLPVSGRSTTNGKERDRPRSGARPTPKRAGNSASIHATRCAASRHLRWVGCWCGRCLRPAGRRCGSVLSLLLSGQRGTEPVWSRRRRRLRWTCVSRRTRVSSGWLVSSSRVSCDRTACCVAGPSRQAGTRLGRGWRRAPVSVPPPGRVRLGSGRAVNNSGTSYSEVAAPSTEDGLHPVGRLLDLTYTC